jgi:hypothetical protein
MCGAMSLALTKILPLKTATEISHGRDFGGYRPKKIIVGRKPFVQR